MIYDITTVYALNGDIKRNKCTTGFQVQTTLAPGSPEMKAFQDKVGKLYLPLLHEKMQVYTTTSTPMRCPGTPNIYKGKHKTHYIELYGTHPDASTDGDPALLDVCAVFYKEAESFGNVGEMLIRGALNEGEQQTDNGNNPISTEAQNTRFETFLTGLKNDIAGLPGGKLVLLGEANDDKGAPVGNAAWEAAAREVKDFYFGDFITRQRSKTVESVDAARISTMRREAKRLVSVYNKAKALGEGGAIDAATESDLKEMGKLIATSYQSSERLKLRVPAEVKAYIKAA